jgi:hypothetical protein
MKHLRNIWKFSWLNDGFRTLYESIIYPEVEETLNDWKKYNNNDCVLIGGLAYSYYLKPRPTQDIDLIFLSEEDIPETVYKFKRTRPHGFKHTKTHVEVEVLSPNFLKKSEKLFKKVFNDANFIDGIKVASPISLIALKLARFKKQDQSDIDELIKYCKRSNIKLDFSGYDLSNIEEERLNKSLNESSEEFFNNHMLESRNLFLDNSINKVKINNDTGYDIYLINDGINENSFYYANNMGDKVMKFSDFNFLIKIPSEINEKLEVLYSSTDFKSFRGFEKEKAKLEKWLYSDNNFKKLLDISDNTF